jgi:hypothetical protein
VKYKIADKPVNITAEKMINIDNTSLLGILILHHAIWIMREVKKKNNPLKKIFIDW